MSVFCSRQIVVPVVPKKLSDFAVGESVYLLENGTAVEYLVVNQGIPSSSSLYDSSCDGTWLLRKDIYGSRVWTSASSNIYGSSDIHTYLNGDFYNLFSLIEQAAIKHVKIPYVNGTGSSGSVASGTSGLSTKVFLLSGYEVGFTTSNSSYFKKDGAKLDYFDSGDSSGGTNRAKRIAYLNGTATSWWLRDPSSGSDGYAIIVSTAGSFETPSRTDTYGVRPVIVMSKNALFDGTTLIFTGAVGSLPSGYTRLSYIQSSGTQYINTWFKPTNNTRVVCKISGFEATQYGQVVFGSRTSTSSSDRFCFLSSQTPAGYRSDFYNSNVSFGSGVTFDGVFTIDKNKETTTLDGANSLSNTSGTFTCAYPMFLFGNNSGGSLAGAATLAMYSCKIYESDVLVRDFVPCSNADGEVGLYDLVGQQFYGNAGTGTFTAG